MLSESILTTQFCEWEARHGLHTEHVTITSSEDAAAKIASRESTVYLGREPPVAGIQPVRDHLVRQLGYFTS